MRAGASLFYNFEAEHGVQGVTSSSLSKIISKLRDEKHEASGTTKQLYSVLIPAMAHSDGQRPHAKDMLKQLEQIKKEAGEGSSKGPATKKAKLTNMD